MTEGAAGSMPSKRPMLLAETEKGRLEKVEAGAKRDESSLVEAVAVRLEMLLRADMMGNGRWAMGDGRVVFFIDRRTRRGEGRKKKGKRKEKKTLLASLAETRSQVD